MRILSWDFSRATLEVERLADKHEIAAEFKDNIANLKLSSDAMRCTTELISSASSFYDFSMSNPGFDVIEEKPMKCVFDVAAPLAKLVEHIHAEPVPSWVRAVDTSLKGISEHTSKLLVTIIGKQFQALEHKFNGSLIQNMYASATHFITDEDLEPDTIKERASVTNEGWFASFKVLASALMNNSYVAKMTVTEKAEACYRAALDYAIAKKAGDIVAPACKIVELKSKVNEFKSSLKPYSESEPPQWLAVAQFPEKANLAEKFISTAMTELFKLWGDAAEHALDVMNSAQPADWASWAIDAPDKERILAQLLQPGQATEFATAHNKGSDVMACVNDWDVKLGSKFISQHAKTWETLTKTVKELETLTSTTWFCKQYYQTYLMKSEEQRKQFARDMRKRMRQMQNPPPLKLQNMLSPG